MSEVAELSRELAAHVLDPDPGSNVTLLSKCGFGTRPWFECLVALVGTRIVGFATYSRICEVHTRDKRLWLGDLFVRPEVRRHGVGRALMAALRHRAAELGCTGITLELARGNDAGRSFYHKLGAEPFREVEVLRLSAQR